MKELVDHIRTVHFTVLVVCLALLATSFEEKKRSLVRADDDAKAIEELSRTKDTVFRQINEAARKAAGPGTRGGWFRITTMPTSRPVTGEPVPPQPVAPVFQNSYEFLYFGSPRQESGVDHIGLWSLASGTSVETNDLVDATSPWRTLSDFIAFWDQDHALYRVPPLVGGGPPAPCLSIEALDGIPAPGSQRGILHFDRMGRADIVPAVSAPGFTCAFARQHARDLGINVRALLKKALPYDIQWTSGPSAAAFPDLLAEAKGLEALPLRDLVQQLDTRANTETEKIEIFQTKIPGGQIAVFGSVILCGCQFYLLLHLRELLRFFRHRGSEEMPEGYVGLYVDRLSRTFTVLSITLFPWICLLAAALHVRSESRTGFATALGALAFSLVIGVFTCKEFLQMYDLTGRDGRFSHAAVAAEN